MQKITSIAELKESIRLLEIKQMNEEVLLKEQLKITYESLKPANLIKNTLREITAAPDFKKDVLGATLSIAAGYLSKKATIGSTNNPIKQILGTILQMGVTSIVSKNTDQIKNFAKHLLANLFNNKDKPT